MFIPTYGLVLIGLALLFLLYRLSEFYSRIKKCEFEVYVNTAGIVENPPRFVELMDNKTINIKLDKEAIIVNQVSFNKGMTHIQRISYLVELLNTTMQGVAKTKLDGIKQSVKKMTIYNQLVNELYGLSKHFASNKRRYKKELYKRTKDDFLFTLRVCEEVIDYWSTVGKLQALLGKGKTLRQIHGVNATWNSTKWDSDGRIEIKPRYV